LCIKLVNCYDYTEKHGQQNIKIARSRTQRQELKERKKEKKKKQKNAKKTQKPFPRQNNKKKKKTTFLTINS